MHLPDRPRFLIVRLSAIGDVVHGLPVLNALRDHYPKAHISWVVEGRAGDLLRDHWALDQLVVAPRGWLKSIPTILKLRRELRALRPDVAIDLQCLARSAILAWLSGAKHRIGFDGPAGREMSRWVHNRRVLPTAVHVIDRNLQLLRPLGIEATRVRFDPPLGSTETATVDDYLRSTALPTRFAVINPGAGWASKRWEMDRFAAVARLLGERHSLPTLVVWAGQEEKEWAMQIVAGSDGHAQAAPPTTLRELAALVSRACLFVGSDTGPMHIAAACGTPCVALFGPMPAERNGPYGPHHVALQKMRVEGPSRVRRKATNESMRAISVPDVMDACDEVLRRAA